MGIFNRLKNFFKNGFKMANGKNSAKDWVKKGAITIGLISLGYLLYKLLSNLGKDTVIYRCENCYTILKPKQKKCYRCGYKIIWNN